MRSLPAPTRPSAGLTLLEVAVCIAIALILLGLLFPAIQSPREGSPRNRAYATVRAIARACENFQHDYGEFPQIPAALVGSRESNGYYAYGDTAAGGCKIPNSHLFDVLRAIDRGANAGHALNPRQQNYFEDGRATGEESPRSGFADGAGFPAPMQGQLFDPWGKQYCIIIDADGDSRLNLDAFFRDLTDPVPNSVAVFSMAKNQQIGGKAYPNRLRKEHSNEAPEDITSWD